jgi:hypothetical protein
MKKWGLIVSLLYAVILIGLLSPVFVMLSETSSLTVSTFREFFQNWGYWIVASFFILVQLVLLSLSVDTSQKKFRSRTPVAITAALTGLLLMMLTVVGLFSLTVAITGESKFPDLGSWQRIAAIIGCVWLVWGFLFYLLYRGSDDPVTRALKWLLRGSVLELLVAVPTHVIVRRRHDCCAPAVTGFGITSGIAIMLLAFGPSVALLVKKRMERYERKESEVRA